MGGLQIEPALDLQRERGEFHTIFATTLATSGIQRDEEPQDLIGKVQLEFTDWFARRPADEIIADMRRRVAPLAGIVLEPRKEEAGPPVGKPVQVEVASDHPELLEPAVRLINRGLREVGGFVDIEDGSPIPGKLKSPRLTASASTSRARS